MSNVIEGAIDIDYWHWIGDFGIIDIAIDIETGQWLYARGSLSWLVATRDASWYSGVGFSIRP